IGVPVSTSSLLLCYSPEFPMQFEEFFTIEGLIILLLFIATVVAILSQRSRMPYPVGLVLAGLFLAPFEQLPVINRLHLSIGPELILGLLVPPLVFEAAFHLKLDDLRQNWKTITVLAVPGVALTTLIVGWLVTTTTGLALPSAMLFGALMSATDPVAVIALFRTMGVPKKLEVILEGESLFNDGTAIGVFNIVLAVVLQGVILDGPKVIADFTLVAGGGLLVGVILGFLVSLLISRITQPLIEATLTTVLAYGAYALAEMIGVSGVLAVVAAGLVGGNFGRQRMAPTTLLVVYNLWEFAAFIANSFVFLVIGLEVRFSVLAASLPAIFWACVAVLLARLVVVFGLTWVEKIPWNWRRVLAWGGLRGAISLALVLSLPTMVEGRDQIQSMTFGVVLFTLLVQGVTMRRLVKFEKLPKQRTELQDEYERRHARLMASREAYEHLDKLNKQGQLSEYTWSTIAPLLRQNLHTMTSALARLLANAPELHAEELDTAWREKLRAERNAYAALLGDGVISEEMFIQLVSDVDSRLSRPNSGWTELVHMQNSLSSEHSLLIVAIVQEKDAENAEEALNSLGFSTHRMLSRGGFLKTQNVTLLIHAGEQQVEVALSALETTCVHRVEYPNDWVPLLPWLARTQVTVGGATLFFFELDHYEDF
ncbi:MAG TPA: Na+/H+ antiporter, partial [Anaerolineales bacterium]|nr:Na+/H+ antiporter [Anaerolineales bacterium]